MPYAGSCNADERAAGSAWIRDVRDCGAERIVFLGDIVGYGASRAECVDLVRKLRIPTGLACAVTVGAVGQPRGEPDHCASWVLCGPAEGVVEFKKTNYNRLQAAQEILRVGLPLESALRLLREEEEPLLDLLNGAL